MTSLARVLVTGDEPSARVRVSGEIDASNADAVRVDLEATVTSPSLTLDLSQLEYLDSAGVRAIFGVAETALTRGTELRLLVADGSPIRRVLDVTGIADVVRVETEPMEA